VCGSVAPGFVSVRDAFERNFADGGELGAAFAAYVDGELVVDLWGGVADASRGVPWRGETLVPVFSGSKGLVATCVLKLVEAGVLELEAPVCRYWPEFAAEGKEGILVRHVVSHQAGMPGLLTPVSLEEATDPVRMAALLAAQRPIAAPGSQTIYHAVTFGWLCGELVRRVDGRSVGRFLREEIAEPLGLEAWIGLPEEFEPRVAVIERPPGFGAEMVVSRERDELAWSVWANPPRFAAGGLAANLPMWHAAEVPATSGIVSARSLARLYGCLARGGELDGVRLLAPETIEQGRRPLSRGHDPYADVPIGFATGFGLQTSQMSLGPEADAFGHGGAGGSMHGAWPALRTGFSYAPNRLARLDVVDERAGALLDALRRSLTMERELR
jgi:CubicO group peptidase (beta-lactamase class C family)